MALKGEQHELTIEEKINNLYFLNKKFNNNFNKITLNSYTYTKEAIEETRDVIINFINDNSKQLCEKIIDIIKSLEEQKRNDLIKNIKEIEINLKKFFYKSYSKFEPSNKQVINYWRNEHLSTYKKYFFENKSKEVEKLVVESVNDEQQSLIINESLEVQLNVGNNLTNSTDKQITTASQEQEFTITM